MNMAGGHAGLLAEVLKIAANSVALIQISSTLSLGERAQSQRGPGGRLHRIFFEKGRVASSGLVFFKEGFLHF